MNHDPFQTLQSFNLADGRSGRFHSLPCLEQAGFGAISSLPVCLRIVLESVLRHCDGGRVPVEAVEALAGWEAEAPRSQEIPFIVARILLQDFTGVPLLVDLAAMRSAAHRLGAAPELVEPSVPVDLVIDHSVQVDYWGRPDALQRNLEMEYRRNAARYSFLKWGRQAFGRLRVVPPGIGICHQVNLETLALGVVEREGVYFPDTLVGTDSHTTMINGLGIVGWGVGGIEAEAAMLGQPVYMLMPDVVGVHLSGRLGEGVTATDLVLHITQMLRAARVVGKFVEFHGEGAAGLTVPDRATIANMAPEYGATLGFFPIDDRTLEYYRATGRSEAQVELVRAYFTAQSLYGMPQRGQCRYSTLLELDLGSVEPAIAGPKRPQDRIPLSQVKTRFAALLRTPVGEGGYGLAEAGLDARHPVRLCIAGDHVQPGASGGAQQPGSAPERPGATNTNVWTETEMMDNRPTPDPSADIALVCEPVCSDLGHGDVAIAAITSCTNTSNPSVMLAAGLLAKAALERGLRLPPAVKASLAPGSRVVTAYLERAGLLEPLERLGFALVGYGCTTCIGNSGPIDPDVERVIDEHGLVLASVLSGNRNFEARVHQKLRANFLMSPPLVVAFALAGRVGIDLHHEPLGHDGAGRPVYLHELWPTSESIQACLPHAQNAESFRRLYDPDGQHSDLWDGIPVPEGAIYRWDAASTYIHEPPYFVGFAPVPAAPAEIVGARALAILGDSVTTDHISPAGAIAPDSPAGRWLQQRGVQPQDFNSYGARRGNDEVMTRGTFANIRIRNRMAPGTEGGYTRHQPDGELLSIYDAAQRYQSEGVPLVVIAGQEYGTGSSRDWAAKGTRLLGVRAVIAQSFERIHRSNLVGMGVLPCQFEEGTSAQTLGLDGSEVFDLQGHAAGLQPQQRLTLRIRRSGGETVEVPVRLRIDTPTEVEYYRHGGILPYVLRQLLEDGRGGS